MYLFSKHQEHHNISHKNHPGFQVSDKYNTLTYLTAKMDQRGKKPAHSDLRCCNLPPPPEEKT